MNSIKLLVILIFYAGHIYAQPLILNLPIQQLPYKVDTIGSAQRIQQRFGNAVVFSALPNGAYIDDLSGHPLIAACREAYYYHQGFELSPQVFWLTVMQGATLHVQQNSGKLKDKFTGKDEKITIKLKLPAGEVDWPDILNQLTSQALTHLPAEWSTVSATRFSNTTELHAQVFNLSFLNMVDHYFIYQGDEVCGIPQIKITGTAADWQLIRERIQFLNSIDMAWWLDDLQDILQKIDDAFNQKIDEDFWCSIYQPRKDGCQEPYVGGWIAKMIPYVKMSAEPKYGVNKMLMDTTLVARYKMDNFPYGSSGIEFLLNKEKHKISGGIVGSTLETGNFITPQLGWGVMKHISENNDTSN